MAVTAALWFSKRSSGCQVAVFQVTILLQPMSDPDAKYVCPLILIRDNEQILDLCYLSTVTGCP